MNFNPRAVLHGFIACAVFIATMLVFPAATAAERHASLMYAYTDDGGCAVAGHAVGLQADHIADQFRARGEVRTAPSGGNCEVDALSYGLSAEQDFATGWNGVEVTVKLLADHRSTSAPYALLGDDGEVLTRADGQALFATILPGGAADTVVGAALISREIGFGETDENGDREHVLDLSAGVNVVPVDWAASVADEPGRTAHFGIRYTYAGLDAVWNMDIGDGTFGDFTVTYRRDLIGTVELIVQASHAFGLDVVDPGVPHRQTVAGADFAVAGAPRSRASHASIGLSIEI